MTTETNIELTDQEKPKKWIPLGMIFLLVYLIIAIIGSLMVFIHPVLIFGKYALTGFTAITYQLVNAALLTFSFVGILKKKIWGRKLLTYYLSFMIFYAIIHYSLFLLYPQEVTELMNSITPVSQFTYSETFMHLTLIGTLAFSLGLNLFIIYYLNKKKDFFTN